jgi:hypothetical protein
MNEKEIRAKYETLQNDIRVSAELKHRTLAQAREAEKIGAASAAADHPTPAISNTGSASTKRTQRAYTVWRRIAVVTAACLTVVTLGLGISVLSRSESVPIGGEIPSADIKSTPVVPIDFSIQAYADSADQVFNPNLNEILFFESSMLMEGLLQSSIESLRKFGWYTWCVFSIQGEDITRMQIETSKGELYRYTPRQLTGDEDPEFIQAARAWKPTHGTFLGEYDSVNIRGPLNYGEIVDSSIDEDEARARLYSAEATWNIDLMKRLGPVADITIDATDSQQAEDYLFGLWTNEGALGHSSLLNSFDDETLAVTVWFEDGHQSAMTIKLDRVAVKCKPIYVDVGYGPRRAGTEFTDEIVDWDNLSEQKLQEIHNEGYQIMYALRGIIIEAHSTAE